MNSQFGNRIRMLRGKQNLFLRQIAPLLEMDTAQLSKIEKGIRQLKRDQIPAIAKILQTDQDELLTLWIADQIIDVTKNEHVALKAMQVAEKEIMSKVKIKQPGK
jgi:transcriptional regulator with XRE-family HTH domain